MDLLSVSLSCVVCCTDFLHILEEGESMDSLSLNGVGSCPKCVTLCIVCVKSPFDKQNEIKLCVECYNRHVLEETMVTSCNNGIDSSNVEHVDGSNDMDIVAEEEEEEEEEEEVQDNKTNGDLGVCQQLEEEDARQECILLSKDNKTNGDLGAVMCQQLEKVYTKINGGLGSDGNGGSTNGELTNSSCQKICSGLLLNASDMLLDIGSGSGLTLAKLFGLSDCKLGIGIELEPIRHDIAVGFNNALMDNFPDKDFRIAFMNADVQQISSFNGFSKIYMYDPVFTDDLMRAIGETFNKSSTVELIASTNSDLRKYGFNVEKGNTVGCLAARGGNMSHSFYIFRSDHYKTQRTLHDVIDRRIVDASNAALNKHIRLQYCIQHLNAVEKAERFPRGNQLQFILGGDSNTQSHIKEFGEAAKKLYKILCSDTPIVRGTTYTINKKTPTYCMYNVTALIAAGKCEAMALCHVSSEKALIAPSFDGNPEGNILVGLIFNDISSNKKYCGVVYDILTNTFQEKAITDILNKFDHENSMPFDIREIQLVSYYVYIMLCLC